MVLLVAFSVTEEWDFWNLPLLKFSAYANCDYVVSFPHITGAMPQSLPSYSQLMTVKTFRLFYEFGFSIRNSPSSSGRGLSMNNGSGLLALSS